MNGFDPHQLIAALMAAVAALFVLSGLPPAARWRVRFRRAAVAVYLAAAAMALIGVAAWLTGWNPTG
jgi:hypothetical protein